MTEDEFIELYDQLHRHLFRFANARLQADELAQDVVAETFRIAWEKRDAVSDQARSASAYVMGIGKMVVLRAMQDRQRHPEDAYEDARLLAYVTPAGDIADEVLESHRGQSIYEQLSPSDQLLLSLMTSPHIGPAEVAESLGLTRNAYAVRVHRIRRRIEELTREYDQVSGGGRAIEQPR